MRLVRLLPALLLAACQPQARHLLLVDLTLSDPLVLESWAEPWHTAGYRVEYRRFYPHLTRSDLARYRTVIVLGGREPEGISDVLTIGDLAILTEWIRRDGVVVLGYTADSGQAVGTLDRWIMNRWLTAQGTGLVIGTQSVTEPATPLPASALDNAGFAPFPAGRSYRLVVRDRSQTLARGATSPVVAASRVSNGLVVVASRDMLGAADANPRAGDFLVALARWTRRPAEWPRVAPAAKPTYLTLVNAPAQVAVHPPPLRPPPGATAIAMPQPVPFEAAMVKPPVPGWISRQGFRGLWTTQGGGGGQGIDALLAFVDAAALNALATEVPATSFADTAVLRNSWRSTAERLHTTSLRWFPAVSLAKITTEGADEVDRHGELAPVPCGLDSVFWRTGLRPVYRVLSRLGGARPDLIAGVTLDLESAVDVYSATGFCESDYREGLAALGLERSESDRLAVLPPTVRYDTLLERGLLGRYYERLESSVAERATMMRAELRRLHPELRFAFRAPRPPVDWFSIGLLRGLSTQDAPVFLWTPERQTEEQLQRYRDRGITALSMLALDPQDIAPNEWGRLRSLLFVDHEGFVLERVASDSVGRLIRRLSK